jgi:SynChlorMet cassette protein ScmD
MTRRSVLSDKDNVFANPSVVLREELDDWAILFDPNTGEGFAINPISAFIWKCLDGQHTVENILAELRENCDDVPDDAANSIDEFIQELLERGLAGHEA